MRWARNVVALVAVMLPCLGVHGAEHTGAVALREVADDFDTPVSIAAHPSKPGHILVAERSGIVVSLDTKNGETQEVVDIEDLISDLSTSGILGIAARSTDTQDVLFVAYLDPQSDLVVGRFPIVAGKTLNEDSMAVIIKIARLAPNFLGSNLDVGPDGVLYIGIGDGEGPALPRSHTAQSPRSLLGKIIRIHPKNPSGYSTPSDNPFVGQTTHHPEIWAFGFRSPDAVSFDATFGRLVVLDSSDTNNEVNIVERGKNYGWDTIDGTTCLVKHCPATGFSAPAVTLKKSAPESRLTGGITYRGEWNTKFKGSIIFAETTTSMIYAVREARAGTWDLHEVVQAPKGTISALGADHNGELFIATSAGKIFALK